MEVQAVMPITGAEQGSRNTSTWIHSSCLTKARDIKVGSFLTKGCSPWQQLGTQRIARHADKVTGSVKRKKLISSLVSQQKLIE